MQGIMTVKGRAHRALSLCRVGHVQNYGCAMWDLLGMMTQQGGAHRGFWLFRTGYTGDYDCSG